MTYSPFRRLACGGLVLAAANLSPMGEAKAGFFDFLFAPPQPQIAPPVYSGERHAPHRKKVHKPKPIAAKPHIPARVVSDIMEDDSLRRGDIVMTSEGLRVFTGSTRTPHSPADFEALSFGKRRDGRREALLAIESSRSRPSVRTGRSVAEPGLAVGEMITDARGVRVRYVGP